MPPFLPASLLKHSDQPHLICVQRVASLQDQLHEREKELQEMRSPPRAHAHQGRPTSGQSDSPCLAQCAAWKKAWAARERQIDGVLQRVIAGLPPPPDFSEVFATYPSSCSQPCMCKAGKDALGIMFTISSRVEGVIWLDLLTFKLAGGRESDSITDCGATACAWGSLGADSCLLHNATTPARLASVVGGASWSRRAPGFRDWQDAARRRRER